MRLPLLVVVVCALVAAACGGDRATLPTPTRFTAPTPTYPSVAGTYIGTATLTDLRAGVSQTCPANTVVTQSGAIAQVAPLVLTGPCGGLSIPIGNVDVSDGLTDQMNGTEFDASCGTYAYTASGGFFGRELRLTVTMASSTCAAYNLNLTILLTR